MTKTIVVSALVALLIGGATAWLVGGNQPAVDTSRLEKAIETLQAKQLGGETRFPDSDLSADSIGAGRLEWNTYSQELPAATSTIFVQNTGPSTMYVKLASVDLNGTASSTYVIEVATSSVGFFNYPNAGVYSDIFAGIINNAVFATTSTATTTSNFATGVAAAGDRIVPVLANQWIGFLLRNGSGVAGASQPLCNGSVCETSTSTNRGINPVISFEFYSTTTRANSVIN